ncbi:MAG: hypothetical protein HYT77_09955 [Deltaproteobacteria bacterium]|nr:hypothetical protein [Deltaproteobacteria bacterium]
MFKKVVVLILFLAGGILFAYPDSERAPSSLSEPPLNLVSSQADFMVIDNDNYLFVSFGSTIKRIDLETWTLASEQVPALQDNSKETGGQDLRGDIKGLSLRGSTLFAAQADGDLIVINLSKITENPRSIDLGSDTLGQVVADQETASDDDKLYIADTTNNAILIYDISDEKVTTTISLKDAQGTGIKPVALTLAQFPSASSNTSTDTLYVTTDKGKVFVIDEGSTAVTATITLATTDKSLPALATSPERNFLFVVNSTDSSLHVINTLNDTEVDTSLSQSGTNPISLSPNGSLKGVAVTSVTDPTDIYAYVTGSGGVSVVDLDLGTSSFDSFTVKDFNDTGSSDTEDNPLPLSSAPGPIVTTSGSEARLFASLSNAKIAIIQDHPFVTIQSTSLGTSSLTQGGSFTMTFQADEAGTYTVRVGGNRTQSGTSVDSGTVSSGNTDQTTATINYDSKTFSEGTNRLFVFVTDSEGNVGRDAVDITVDTPPPAVTIREVGFGNESLYVTFDRLSASDVRSYRIYLDKTDASLATLSSAGSVSQPAATESTVTAKISGLDNGDLYQVGVEAVDNGGNVGSRTTTLSGGVAASGRPEATVGVAGRAGEAGCTLLKGTFLFPRFQRGGGLKMLPKSFDS